VGSSRSCRGSSCSALHGRSRRNWPPWASSTSSRARSCTPGRGRRQPLLRSRPRAGHDRSDLRRRHDPRRHRADHRAGPPRLRIRRIERRSLASTFAWLRASRQSTTRRLLRTTSRRAERDFPLVDASSALGRAGGCFARHGMDESEERSIRDTRRALFLLQAASSMASGTRVRRTSCRRRGGPMRRCSWRPSRASASSRVMRRRNPFRHLSPRVPDSTRIGGDQRRSTSAAPIGTSESPC
jgi:hypothetical protein